MDLVRVKEKAILIYKAYKGEMDYDNLKIHSVIDSFPNATLNFAKTIHDCSWRGRNSR
jgi:hypothetical protein